MIIRLKKKRGEHFYNVGILCLYKIQSSTLQLFFTIGFVEPSLSMNLEPSRDWSSPSMEISKFDDWLIHMVLFTNHFDGNFKRWKALCNHKRWMMITYFVLIYSITFWNFEIKFTFILLWYVSFILVMRRKICMSCAHGTKMCSF